MRKTVDQINQLEPELQALTSEQLKNKTTEFKQRINLGESLDDILPEAFATVRETAKRVLEMRHFDVQMIGGIVLHQGKITEMRTGEGKTLVATLAAYLNALSGGSVHVITVNDYLAKRDAEWMAPLYKALGMSIGIIQSYQGPDRPSSFAISDTDDTNQASPCSRRDAYATDIIYGTNNEFGFDYLRDNMVLSLDDKSQRDLSFAIIDEVDSILIDEARTPLIISGAAQDSSELYKAMNKLVKNLQPQEQLEGDEQASDPTGDFILDEKIRGVELTEQGHQKIEEILIKANLLPEDENLYQATNLGLLHHVHSALRAQHLFQNDIEYIVQNGEAVLVDEHTGRS
jgi:preprotein translocase subunit SecA